MLRIATTLFLIAFRPLVCSADEIEPGCKEVSGYSLIEPGSPYSKVKLLVGMDSFGQDITQLHVLIEQLDEHGKAMFITSKPNGTWLVPNRFGVFCIDGGFYDPNLPWDSQGSVRVTISYSDGLTVTAHGAGLSPPNSNGQALYVIRKLNASVYLHGEFEVMPSLQLAVSNN